MVTTGRLSVINTECHTGPIYRKNCLNLIRILGRHFCIQNFFIFTVTAEINDYSWLAEVAEPDVRPTGRDRVTAPGFTCATKVVLWSLDLTAGGNGVS